MDREVLVSKYVKRVQRMCLEGRKTAQERAVVETLLELQGKPAPEWPEARVRPPKARKRGEPRPSPLLIPTSTQPQYKEHEAVLVAAVYAHQKGAAGMSAEDVERAEKMLASIVSGGSLNTDE